MNYSTSLLSKSFFYLSMVFVLHLLFSCTSQNKYANYEMATDAVATEGMPFRDAEPIEPQFNTEDYATIRENNFKEVKNEPLSTFSIDVDRASYSNVRRFIKNNQEP